MNTVNPFAETVAEAEDLLTALMNAGERLAQAIATERIARARAQDAKETLGAAEAELVLEAEALSQAGEGPLASIKAKTSKAYDYAVQTMLRSARQGDLARIAREADGLTIAADQAAIELQQAQTMFTATKYAAELKAAILTASAAPYRI